MQPIINRKHHYVVYDYICACISPIGSFFGEPWLYNYGGEGDLQKKSINSAFPFEIT